MSRIIKMVGLMALIAAFGLASTAIASPPVPPPVEGFYIDTTTLIDCVGTTTETEAFSWTYGTGTFDVATLTMGAGDSAAQIRYEENFTAIDGATMFSKSFAAYSHAPDAPPNLAVDKDFGFVGDITSMIASLDESERVGIGIVSYGYDVAGAQIAGLEGICPWAGSSSGGTIPATNEFISMGSTVKTGVNMFAETPAIVATKDTAATTTGSPALSHLVTGSGYGEITASMALHLQEGAGTFAPGTGAFQLKSETRYTQDTLASGIIANFSKEMKYRTSLPTISPLSTWDAIFNQ